MTLNSYTCLPKQLNLTWKMMYWWSWVHCCNLSVAGWSISCWSQMLRQIIDLLATDKIINFKNNYWTNTYIICFITGSPEINLNHSLTAQESNLIFFTQERGYRVLIMHEQNLICSQTHLDWITPEQTINLSSAGYVAGSQATKRKKSD